MRPGNQHIRAVLLYILRNTAYTAWIVYALQVLNANSEYPDHTAGHWPHMELVGSLPITVSRAFLCSPCRELVQTSANTTRLFAGINP